MSSDGVRRRVVLAGPTPRRFAQSSAARGAAQVRVLLQPRAAQQAGAAGAALVVADQPEAILELGQRS